MKTKKKKVSKRYEAIIYPKGLYSDYEKEKIIINKAKEYRGVNTGAGFDFSNFSRDLSFDFKSPEDRRNFLRCAAVKKLCRKKYYTHNQLD
jgi:hypothetical protein